MKNQQRDTKEAKQFWVKIWEKKEHNRKAEWMNYIKKSTKT